MAMLFFLVLMPGSICTQVSGVILNASINSGDDIKHEITIKADENDPAMDYTAKLFGFGMAPDGVKQKIDPDVDSIPYSALDFLNITPTNFHLEAGESQTLIVEGKVPSDAKEGARYALVNIKSEPLDGSENVGIVVAFDIPILLTIKDGELIDTGEITGIEVSELASGGQQVSVMFKNTGNHHYKALAEVTLKDVDGDVISVSSSPLSFSSIIPTYSWLFKLPLDESLAPGNYSADVKMIKSDGTVLDSEVATIQV